MEGYRPDKNLVHYRTLQTLPLIVGDKRKADADYLDACRINRNTVEYDYAGGVTGCNTDELIESAKELETEVLARLKSKHLELSK